MAEVGSAGAAGAVLSVLARWLVMLLANLFGWERTWVARLGRGCWCLGMADPKRALVLHLAGGEPVVFALSDDSAHELASELGQLLTDGRVSSVGLADGSVAAVNFGHVVTAHLDELPPLARVYGAGQPRKHGFATS